MITKLYYTLLTNKVFYHEQNLEVRSLTTRCNPLPNLGSSHARKQLEMRYLQTIMGNQVKFASPLHPLSFPNAQNY